MTPSKAYEIASQWGSNMTSGDPGAIFYTFPTNDGRPQNEDHRRALIGYTDTLIGALAGEQRNKGRKLDDMLDVKQLTELRAFFQAWPLELDEFTRAYIECALWSSTDNADDSGGEPLDRNYSIVDIHPDSLAEMVADCVDFKTSFATDIEAALAMRDSYTESSAGHDFWLTRNHHGAGFWDRGLGDVGKKLTDMAHPYGEVDLYVGDDKKLHI